MSKRSEEAKLARKIKEWDVILNGLKVWAKKAWISIKREARIDWNNMWDFILYYKPKNKWDKLFHFIEMVCFYIILQFAWIGMTRG